MSDAEPVLDDRDTAVWEAIGGGDIDAADLSRDELVRIVEQMAADFIAYRTRTNREHTKLHNRISDIGRKADGKLVSETPPTD